MTDTSKIDGSKPASATPIEFGARVELRQISSPTEVTIAYEARWVLPHQSFLGRAMVATDGTITIEVGDADADADAPDPGDVAEPASAPDWLLKFTESLLRTLRRTVESDDGASWPRRLTRWKNAPEAR